MPSKYQEGFDAYITEFKTNNKKFSTIAIFVKAFLNLTTSHPTQCISQSKNVKTDQILKAKIDKEIDKLKNEAGAGPEQRNIPTIVDGFLTGIETLGKQYQQEIDSPSPTALSTQTSAALPPQRPKRPSLIVKPTFATDEKVESVTSPRQEVAQVVLPNDHQEKLAALQRQLAEEAIKAQQLQTMFLTTKEQHQKDLSELSQLRIEKQKLELQKQHAEEKARQDAEKLRTADTNKSIFEQQIASLRRTQEQYETQIATLSQSQEKTSKEVISLSALVSEKDRIISDLSRKQVAQAQENAQLKQKLEEETQRNMMLQKNVDTIPALTDEVTHQKKLVEALQIKHREEQLAAARRASPRHSLAPSVPATPMFPSARQNHNSHILQATPTQHSHMLQATPMQPSVQATPHQPSVYSQPTPAMFSQRRGTAPMGISMPQTGMKPLVAPLDEKAEKRKGDVKDKIKAIVGEDKIAVIDTLFQIGVQLQKSHRKELMQQGTKNWADDLEALIRHLMVFHHLPLKSIFDMQSYKDGDTSLSAMKITTMEFNRLLGVFHQQMNDEKPAQKSTPITHGEVGTLKELVLTDKTESQGQTLTYSPYLVIRSQGGRKGFNVDLENLYTKLSEQTTAFVI